MPLARDVTLHVARSGRTSETLSDHPSVLRRVMPSRRPRFRVGRAFCTHRVLRKTFSEPCPYLLSHPVSVAYATSLDLRLAVLTPSRRTGTKKNPTPSCWVFLEVRYRHNVLLIVPSYDRSCRSLSFRCSVGVRLSLWSFSHVRHVPEEALSRELLPLHRRWSLRGYIPMFSIGVDRHQSSGHTCRRLAERCRSLVPVLLSYFASVALARRLLTFALRS